ncbi:hypothetical protein PpBr36_07959 [Pyricularia pennisetigena]|uniref:hypothetical protein n=1 Tax=Pyricularia pennisetigena TaxID=1578925 RepID=UPI0011549F64|nr:hypothetical protein PpBr36_07959 [Pyricularia pennisetigena]TLS25119.1 hypothetical protein PpBr36_07959 [Pyricularia pennisetigena]
MVALAPFNLRMLIVSVGNPPPLHETLHSAGHMVLRQLQQHLDTSTDSYQPGFSTQRFGTKNCIASIGPKYTLVQSPTQMNIVGPWLASAWKQHSKLPSDQHPALVVLQDELELEFGKALTREWASSHKGHNGIRSAQQSLPPSIHKNERFARVRIGIGRPQERDRSHVSDYVLRRATPDEKEVLEDHTAPSVVTILGELEKKWRRAYMQSLQRDASP